MEMTLKEKFINELISEGNGTPLKGVDVLVTLVKLPTNSIEVITNSQGIRAKIEYLIAAYDEDFKLKANPNVQIVGYVAY